MTRADTDIPSRYSINSDKHRVITSTKRKTLENINSNIFKFSFIFGLQADALQLYKGRNEGYCGVMMDTVPYTCQTLFYFLTNKTPNKISCGGGIDLFIKCMLFQVKTTRVYTLEL